MHKLSKSFYIKPKSIVFNTLCGLYKLAFKGSGQDYFQSRIYEEGDDAKYIDSRLTARNIEIYTKEFTEERQNEVIFLIDFSSSISSFEQSLQLIWEIVNFLGNIVLSSGDKLGYVVFGNGIFRYQMPKKNQSVLYELKKYLKNKKKYEKTNISFALDFLFKNFKKNSFVYIISDFFDDNYFNNLNITSQKFDMIVIKINHTFKINENIFIFSCDSENSKAQFIQSSDLKFDCENKIEDFCKKLNIDFIETDNLNHLATQLYNIMRKRAYYL